MAHDAKRLGKPVEVKRQSEEARENPPVDARTTMWRAVKLYAWLATLICAVWGLVVFTAYVYRQPPSCPPNPLSQTLLEVREGMPEDEALAAYSKYAGGHRGWLELFRDSSHTAENGGRKYQSRDVRYRWIGDYDSRANGEWGGDLNLFFVNGHLQRATYQHYWRSHDVIEERSVQWEGGRVIGSHVGGGRFVPDEPKK